MNKIITQICLLCLLLIVASCNKDPEYYTLEIPADQMFLKASSSEVTLGKEYENETAVTFTWNVATDRGADANITYYFKMYMVELSSNVTELYKIESEERSISFTHRQLNDILTTWNMAPGSKVTIEAEVIAQVNSTAQYMKPELSKTQFNAIGYDKNATAIYMVMVANNGEKTIKRMTEKVVGNGIYQSSVELSPCKYYFTLSADAEYPRYMKGTKGDNSLQYANEAGDYEMFENTKTGTYTVVTDLNMLDVNIVHIYPLPNNGVWIVGNSCDVDWNMDAARTKGAFQNKDPRHPELWTYTGNFYYRGGIDKNEFKLSVDLDWGGRFFFAPTAAANPATNHTLGVARYQADGGDLKWAVTADGKYTLTLNLDKMEIHLTPAE